ncbi:MAG: site-2 protease family protein [Elusimicrobia bacterium]|nr:site-2 protease family protein [Elusimicrobiota bacterium]
MLISFVAFIVVFSIIVLVHEFGHFIAARKAGVRVYEFSIGFPFSPRILKLFSHKETEFTLRLLPLGGFVSFSKEGDEDAKDLFGVCPLKRAMILSAGSFLNIIFAFLLFIPIFVISKDLNFIDAIFLSSKTTWAMLSGTITFLFNVVSGNGVVEGILGPVGIASLSGQAASKGILNLLHFTGVLSMNLGIMNLIPLPALDGGHLFMLLIESIKKKPISLKTYQAINLMGLSLFVILTIIITYKDIVRLIA